MPRSRSHPVRASLVLSPGAAVLARRGQPKQDPFQTRTRIASCPAQWHLNNAGAGPWRFRDRLFPVDTPYFVIDPPAAPLGLVSRLERSASVRGPPLASSPRRPGLGSGPRIG